jgi:hypothetical protein
MKRKALAVVDSVGLRRALLLVVESKRIRSSQHFSTRWRTVSVVSPM